MSQAVLELDELRVSLQGPDGPLAVLRGVSFAVAPGEAVALVGESGSGKSMTARAIVRLLPPGARLSGTILLNGTDIAQLGGRALRRARGWNVATIFQDPRASVNPVRSCGSQLGEVLRQRGLARTEVTRRSLALLEDVGLRDPERVLRANPIELSGGMLQRLMIAMALAAEPELLIADEATTALDVTIQAEIVALINDLCRQRGLALLFITHDLELASVVCSRSLVMYAGKIVEDHATADLFASPAHPYTAALLGARPQLELHAGRLAAIPGRPPSFHALPEGCAFAPRCPHAIPQCRAHEPTLDRLRDGTLVACVRAGELARSGLGRPSARNGGSVVRRWPGSTQALVVADGLAKTFRTNRTIARTSRLVEAVSEVSFVIEDGGALGIVGESGSGKTTLARMLVGLERPTCGTVSIAGELLGARASPADRRRRARLAQIVFQDPYTSLDPRQNVRSVLDEVQQVHFERDRTARERRCDELLEAVGLGAREGNAVPRNLSGGQRQRVAIARALAAEPRLLVLDEAVSALDVSVQAQILNLLNDLREQFGLTYLLISHDLAVVRHVAEEVIVMYQGRIVEAGSAQALLSAPRDPYTRQLIASAPRIGMQLERGSPTASLAGQP